MMNYIWGGMVLFGLFFAAVSGSLSGFADGLMNSSTRAVWFILSLCGVMAIWSGFMEIAEQSGLIDRLAKALRPLISWLFPEEKNSDTIAMMLMSYTANIFGAGNSATVFSLKAMEMLDRENGRSETASNAMCMFTAVSMSMIQLAPVTVIKLRADLGSADSGSVILPSILAGLLSMAASIAVCKLCERRP